MEIFMYILIALIGAGLVLLGVVITLMFQIISDLKTEEPQPIKTPSKPLFKAKSKPTEEEIRFQKLMTNIDNYTGSGKGQVKI